VVGAASYFRGPEFDSQAQKLVLQLFFFLVLKEICGICLFFLFQVLELDTPANLMSNPDSKFSKMLSVADAVAKG
jgi:hypothetical protein